MRCKECKDTGFVELLTSREPCTACGPRGLPIINEFVRREAERVIASGERLEPLIPKLQWISPEPLREDSAIDREFLHFQYMLDSYARNLTLKLGIPWEIVHMRIEKRNFAHARMQL